MTKLTELLEKKNYIWVNIKPKQRRRFLKFAKNNGFKWFTGNEILLNGDCYFVVAMFKDMTIANIPAMHRVFGDDRDTVYKISFSDILKNKYHE